MPTSTNPTPTSYVYRRANPSSAASAPSPVRISRFYPSPRHAKVVVASHPPPELGFADSSEIRSGSSSKGTTDSKTRAEGNVDTYGTFGAEIKRKLKQLSDHGCHSCGSVPLSDGNDPAEAGILTVNYISSVACPGLCPPTHYYADALVEAY